MNRQSFAASKKGRQACRKRQKLYQRTAASIERQPHPLSCCRAEVFQPFARNVVMRARHYIEAASPFRRIVLKINCDLNNAEVRIEVKPLLISPRRRRVTVPIAIEVLMKWMFGNENNRSSSKFAQRIQERFVK